MNNIGASRYIYILFFVVLSLLIIVDNTSLLFFAYSFTICAIISKLFCKNSVSLNLSAFLFYTFIAIIIYSTHKYLIPDYIGLTGPEGGIGTDDCRYYAQLVDGHVPYELQFNFFKTLPFSKFLDFCLPFHIYTPLNVIIFNLLGITFLPYIIYRFLLEFTKSEQVSRDGYNLSLICPYTVYFGSIIMRDMWIATAVVLGILLFKQKKYFWLFIISIFICFLRFGSIVFLALPILVIIREHMLERSSSKKSTNIKFTILLVAIFSAFYLSMPMITFLSDGRLDEGLFRLSIVEHLKADDENAVIVKILNLPFPINLILASVFFYFLPFLRFDVYTLGVFNVGSLFGSIFTPLFFFPFWKYLMKSILDYWNGRDEIIRPIILSSILIALALGTVSLQARHKTVLVPFMCMLMAYGKNNFYGLNLTYAKILGSCIVCVELLYAFLLLI